MSKIFKTSPHLIFTINTFLLFLFVGYLFVGMMDNRFKSYDAFFMLENGGVGCLDVSQSNILTYYQDRETPLSEKLSAGKWVCK